MVIRGSNATLIGLLLLSRSACALPTTKHVAAPEVRIDFNRDIRPILTANCFSCHGQDATARQAALRLDTPEGAVGAISGGRAVVGGHPEMSLLVSRITSSDSSAVMPPVASGRRLNREQKAALILWIKQGAKYAVHWSYSRLTRPTIPTSTLGSSSKMGWIKSPIDAFVLADLKKAGLKPSPEADRYTLIRRLSLDLTGLPPTLDEAKQFASDRSPDAYEKVVDRLLASPHYGEHWARMWLDLARYADSQGYEKDQPRVMWRYRDWVIDAFNSDMPFDRFTIEQLAGDLLPSPTQSQILATGFHRNTMTNTEGGVDQEEFRTAAIKDRVDTTVQVWMGLTMGCAKCHSHKYDPITQQDYYKFYALFNQTSDANNYDDSPRSPMPTEDQQLHLEALNGKLKTWREAVAKRSPELDERERAWERTMPENAWRTLVLKSASAESGAEFHVRGDGALLVSGAHKDTDTYTLTFTMPAERVTAVRLEALKDPSLPNGGPGRDATDQNVVTSEFQLELQKLGQNARVTIPLEHPRADFEQGGWPVAAALDGKPDTGWAFSPQNTHPHAAVFDLKEPITEPGAELVVTIRQNYIHLQHGCLRISVARTDPSTLKAETENLADIAGISPASRSASQQKKLDDAFRRQDAETAPMFKELEIAEKDLADLNGKIAQIPIMRELPPDRQRVTHVQLRGNFMDPGDVVTPDVPAAFRPIPEGAPHNRLGAAEWLVSSANSLTPRVAVNRFWARMFGTGLVETEEDFGTQGSPPSNQPLLDWLAISFRDDLKWSMKRLCKTIVMSATYRQSSITSDLTRKLDPRNRLLCHGPRFRLTGEMVRDQALAVSNLLSPKLKGPSVMPPQPDGIWHTVYSGVKWETSPGEDRYRRAIYTYWRRSSPYPAMMTFDAGTGEYCVVRRIRTNTPLQALVTLNDPVFVEAAGALGKLMVTCRGKDIKSHVIFGFRQVLLRPPTPPEVARLIKLYVDSLANFRGSSVAAQALLHAANSTLSEGNTEAEQAAYILVANVLLNLDESLTKQ